MKTEEEEEDRSVEQQRESKGCYAECVNDEQVGERNRSVDLLLRCIGRCLSPISFLCPLTVACCVSLAHAYVFTSLLFCPGFN